MSPVDKTPQTNFNAQCPNLTPDQDQEVDRLVDQGRNYTEALQMAGATPVGQDIEVVPQVTQERPVPARRALSWRERLTADKVPPDYFPYTK